MSRKSQTTIDCRSEEGETVALCDAIITLARQVARRDLNSGPVREALADLRADPEVMLVMDGTS